MAPKLNLSISNIAWAANDDETVYGWMRKCGFTGLEIAPTRIFPDNPYAHIAEAREWSRELYETRGFRISSMQSVWYGKKEKVFGSEKERRALSDYTKRAIEFAGAVGCANLVFGSPVNRQVPNDMSAEEVSKRAIDFLKPLGIYARACGTCLSMEANPPMYNTNFINDTKAATELIAAVGEPGFGLNLDVGTMIVNKEEVSAIFDDMEKCRIGLKENETYILNNVNILPNHVHISEPGLKPIEHRELHRQLLRRLIESGYGGFVSIELGNPGNLKPVTETMEYLKTLVQDVLQESETDE